MIVDAFRETLRPGAGLVVQIPVEGFGEGQPLRGLQAERMDVVDEQQQRGELLASRDDAELRRLLDRIGGVAARIGKTNHLRLGGLSLQQEGGEVGGVQRMLDAAQDLAAIGGDDGASVALKCCAEGVIGGQEEPGIAAGLGQRLAGAVGEHVGVIGIGNGVGVAGLAGEVGARSAVVEQDGVLFLHHVADGKRHAGIRRIGDRIDLLFVDPLPRDIHADVRLVLVIAADHVDLPALRGQTGILHRHLDGHHCVGTTDVGIKARHVAQYADLDDLVVGHLRTGNTD